MSLLERVHRSVDYPRRLARLSAELASVVPRDAHLVFDRSLHFLARLETRVRSKAR